MRDRAFRAAAAVAAVSVLLAAGCRTKGAEGKPPASALARVGGQTVTEADLPAQMRSQIERAERKLFEARLSAVRSLIDQKLLAAAAKKKGVSVEAVEKEVLAGVQEPSAEEVDAALSRPPYSHSLEAQLSSAKTEDEKAGAKAKLTALAASMLRRERHARAREELLKSVEKETGVEILIEPPKLPRVEIATEGSPSRGSPVAPVTIAGFSDMGPAYCQRGRGALERVTSAHPGEIRYVLKLVSFQPNPLQRKALDTAVCAGEQGKVWEYHDGFCDAGPTADARAVAEKIGVDLKALDSCLGSGRASAQVEKDTAQAKALGVTRSPALFLDGIRVGEGFAEDMAALLEIERLARK